MICYDYVIKSLSVQFTITYANEGEVHRIRIMSLTKPYTTGYHMKDVFIYDSELI